MQAKKLILITQAASTGVTYANSLFHFFGSNITLETYSLEGNDFVNMPGDGDLYIVSATSTDAFEQVLARIPGNKKVTGTLFLDEIAGMSQPLRRCYDQLIANVY